MPGPEDHSTAPAGDEQQAMSDATERAHRRSNLLALHIATLAEEIAVSEEKVAATLNTSAELRPHASERLRSAAEHARRFAEREREHSRVLREAHGGRADEA